MAEAVVKKAGWRVHRFDEVGTMVNNRVDNPEEAGVDRYVGLEHLDPESLKIRRWGSPSDVTATKLQFRKGDIIFGRRRVYQRKLAVADFDGICSAHAMVLRAKPEVVLPEFLPFFMQSDLFMERAKEISVGSLSPTINWRTLAKEEFALPPLDEQHRLAKVLKAAAANIEVHQQLLSESTTLSRSYGRHVLSSYPGQVVEVGEVAKFASGKQIRVSGLPQTPSAEAAVPVYGGNGISGYTDEPLETCLSPTVVIGRVGQFCGATLLTTGPAWITDNALYSRRVDPQVQIGFLAMCLRAAGLNRDKLGEYLPLVTQTVVHSARIPRLPEAAQRQHVEEFSRIEAGSAAVAARVERAAEVQKELLVRLLDKGEKP